METTRKNQENNVAAEENLEWNKRTLIRLLEKSEPDYYLVSYCYGSAITEEIEVETLTAAFAIFDVAIRSGASFALLRALWNAPDAAGEVYINIGIHEI